MEKIKSSLVNMVVVMVVIAVLSALALGFVHNVTSTSISESKDNAVLEALREVIPLDFDNNPFEEKTIIGDDKLELYPGRLAGKINSIAIKTFSNLGYGGRIELIVGFYLDGTISGYKITNQKETPGLGTKVMEEKFANQYMGLNPGSDNIGVKQDGGDIDAVTSATISSRAVSDAIQKAYDTYQKLNAGNN